MKGICARKTDYHHNNQQFNHIPTKMVCHLSCKRYETLHHIKQTASQGKRKNGTFSFTRSEGGLATGLDSLQTAYEKHWIGWPGICVDNDSDKQAIGEKLEELNFHPRIPVRHPDKKLLRRLQQQYHLAAVPLFLCLYIVQGHFLASLPRSKQAIL